MKPTTNEYQQRAIQNRKVDLSRREVLIGLVSGAAILLLGACSSETDANPTTVLTRGLNFIEPEVLASKDGLLEVNFKAEALLIEANSTQRYAYAYNGMSPGPTLKARPGDKIIITLENGLDEATNLHTHGLHVSPMGDADNIFVEIDPGDQRRYVYEIPTDHRSGLFWYHPHVHGTVARQVAAGLVGAIIIQDDIDEIPELADANERLWILNDPPQGQDSDVLSVNPMEQMEGREGSDVLVNGVARPVLESKAGQLEQWRIVNASPSRYYQLAVDNNPMYLISTDGGRLETPQLVDELLLTPGERVEVLVTPSEPGQYSVKSLAYNRGDPGMGSMMGNSGTAEEVEVATLTVTGKADPAILPERLATPADFLLPEPTRNRTLSLEMGMGMGMGRGGMMNSGSMMSFTIDGRVFDANRIDIATTLGETEEWIVRNDSEMDHPFHLHTWPFQIVDDDNSWVGWKDTVNIPANEQVRIRIPIVGHNGKTVYHCHILDHEDLGMMGVIEVANRQSDLTLK